MKKWLYIGFSHIVLLMFLASCSSLDEIGSGKSQPEIKQPTIDLVGVRLGKISFLKQKLIVRLKIKNPNDIAIPISSLNFSLTLEKMETAKGVLGERIDVPVLGEKEFDVIVETSIFKISRPVAKFLKHRSKTLDYHISGLVSVDVLFAGTFDFSKKGTITVD
ncbi:MAG: LEA type 2 family protein [Magnetococcales bacterium]|nr:LEA type 2 family protein [Magnetococcales bacterium]